MDVNKYKYSNIADVVEDEYADGGSGAGSSFGVAGGFDAVGNSSSGSGTDTIGANKDKYAAGSFNIGGGIGVAGIDKEEDIGGGSGGAALGKVGGSIKK